MVPVEPCAPRNPCAPGAPRGPDGPAGPGLPASPRGPTSPAIPTSPCGPAGPCSASHSLTPTAIPNWLSRITKTVRGIQIRLNTREKMSLTSVSTLVSPATAKWPWSHLSPAASWLRLCSLNYSQNAQKPQRLRSWWWPHQVQPSLAQRWLTTLQRCLFVPSFLLLRFVSRLMADTCRCLSGEGIERPVVVVLPAVRRRVSVSNEPTQTSSSRETVPVPSHDAHHRPFGRAVCFLDRLLSSGSPTALMNAGGRERSTSPSRASLGICGCAAGVLHSICSSCSDNLTVVAATVKGLTARWGLSLSGGV